MQMVDALALDRVPGLGAAALVGDVSAAVGRCAREAVTRLAREVATVLRTRGPAVAALLASVRAWPVSRLSAGLPAQGSTSPPAPPPATAPPSAASPVAAAAGSGVDAPAARCSAGHHELVLPADPTAPRRARALLRASIDSAAAEGRDVDDESYQDAAMVLTELVANAVDHANTASTVSVRVDDRGLHLAVRDGRPGPAPRPRPIDPSAPRGRGLQMVAALATEWGVTAHPDGKTVWAVLDRP